MDTFELYELPPSRDRVRGAKLPRILPPMQEVSVSPADAERALAAGLVRARPAS